MAMVTCPYAWKILQWDETNKQKKQKKNENHNSNTGSLKMLSNTNFFSSKPSNVFLMNSFRLVKRIMIVK